MPDLIPALTQFGVAGLIGWMWLVERRASTTRDRQLTAAHDRLTAERERSQSLVDLVAANTRAMTSLESSQRDLARVVERLSDVLPVRSRAAG